MDSETVNCTQPRKGFVIHELTEVENSVYRRKTLVGGSDDALFLAEMVNIAEPNTGVFVCSGDAIDWLQEMEINL